MHVYDRKHKEVGLYGPKGWFNKHGLTGKPDGLPDKVDQQCRGKALYYGRKLGIFPEKGEANIKGKGLKNLLKGVWLIGPLIEMTTPSPKRVQPGMPLYNELNP